MPNRPSTPAERLAAANKSLLPQVRELVAYLESPEGHNVAARASKFVSVWLEPDNSAALNSKEFLDQDGAGAFCELLLKHPSAGKPDNPFDPKQAILVDAFGGASVHKSGGFEGAAIIAAGSLAAGLLDGGTGALARALVETGLFADGMSLLLRLTLTGRLGLFDINHPLFGLDVPLTILSSANSCLGGIRASIPDAAAFASHHWGAAPKLPLADANGITGLSVNFGSCRQAVTLRGNFPASRPPEQYVVFPTADAGYTTVTVNSWSPTDIEVLTPERVGDGPVGFNLIPGGFPESDPGALIALGEALGNCLGYGGRLVGLKLSSLVPRSPAFALQAPPTLPGGSNIFHGGPILSYLPPLSTKFGMAAIEEDSEMTVRGRNLLPGDEVVVDDTPCTTTFIDAQTLSFNITGLGLKGAAAASASDAVTATQTSLTSLCSRA